MEKDMPVEKKHEESDYFGIKGKTAVISGGAVNIGRAVSLGFAARGAKIVIIYNSSSTPAEALAAEINSRGGTAAAFGADVGSEESVEALFKKISADQRFEKIDILINNSGIFSSSMQTDLSAAEWQRLFDVNVKGLFLCSREAARRMQKSGGGAIVNLSSINALHPGFGMTAHYDATKGAVAAYTRSLAAELGPMGIRVNAVAPGLVDSAGLREYSAELAEMVEGRNPLRENGGRSRLVEAEDVADTAVFLASRQARSITGEIIVVDRGYLLT